MPPKKKEETPEEELPQMDIPPTAKPISASKGVKALIGLLMDNLRGLNQNKNVLIGKLQSLRDKL